MVKIFTNAQKWYLVSTSIPTNENGNWIQVKSDWGGNNVTFYKYIYKLAAPVDPNAELTANSWEQIEITDSINIEPNVGYFVYVESIPDVIILTIQLAIDLINEGNGYVVIPYGYTTIGEGAFQFCINLTSVSIPDSVTTIGVSAFRDCLSLTSVTIGNSVETIGESAFRDCHILTSVTMYEGITTFGSDVFSETSLTEVTVYYTGNQPNYDSYIPITVTYVEIS